MAALTDVKICNRALIRLGVATINSFSDGSPRANVCAETYPGLRDAILGMTDWRFAMNKVQLSRNLDPPVNQYKYAYDLPADLLAGPFAVYNSTAVSASTVKEWEIYGDMMLTDYELIIIDYRNRPNENKFRPWFVELLVLALAGATAPSLTDKASLAEEYNARAWGTPGQEYHGGWYAIAAQRNDEESEQIELQVDDGLTTARLS